MHKDQRIYLEDPRPHVPERKGTRGRRPKSAVSQSPSLDVSEWVSSQEDSAWKPVELRHGTKGRLFVEILHQRVWLWDGKESEARCWHLIVRRELHSKHEIKYSLSNANPSTQPARLAQMQAQRYWVERAFQDGKSEAGLSDYQARGWRSWQHHMALVMMAMLFMLKERMLQQDDHPLLSCSDIETLLARFLPRRDIDSFEVIRQLEVRHRKRQAAIDSAYSRQPPDPDGLALCPEKLSNKSNCLGISVGCIMDSC